jgi:cell division control protein 45
MYLPRQLISKLYVHLQQTRHPLSPPVLVLVALEPDALCACRILTRLLKHDYIPHKIQPVAGYTDLEKAGRELVMPMMESQGGSGGVVVCLGVGGMVDLGPLLGLEPEGDDQPYSGVEVWVMDAHRPWNLGNVFGGFPLDPETEVSSSYHSRCPTGVNGGMIESTFKPGKGGVIVFDDGDIVDDMQTERNAYLELMEMPEIDDGGEDLGDTDDDDDDENPSDLIPEPVHAGQKRKSWSDAEDESDDDRPHQRRRSNSV